MWVPHGPSVLTVNRELVRKVRGKAQLVVQNTMEHDVGLLRLYPGIPATLVGTRPYPAAEHTPQPTSGQTCRERQSHREPLVPRTCMGHGDLHVPPSPGASGPKCPCGHPWSLVFLWG